MHLSELETRLIRDIDRSRRRQKILCWAALAAWPFVLWLTAIGMLPRLELPIITVIAIFAATTLIRPMHDPRLIGVLERYVAADAQALSAIAGSQTSPPRPGPLE